MSFPVRKQTPFVAHLYQVDAQSSTLVVAQRLWVTATAVRDRAMTATVVLELPQGGSKQYITASKAQVYDWLVEARAVGLLLAALEELPPAKHFRYTQVWREGHPVDVSGNPVVAIMFPKAGAILRAAEDSAKAVLLQHNAEVGRLVRQSSHGVRPALV